MTNLRGRAIILGEMTERLRARGHEESPNTAGTECRLTTGEGDFKESATETDRRIHIRQGWKGRVRAYRSRGDAGGCVNPIRCKIWELWFVPTAPGLA